MLARTLVVVLLMNTLSIQSFSAVAINPVNEKALSFETITIGDLLNTRNRDLAVLLHHRPGWKEKLAIGLLKRKVRKLAKRNPEIKGRTVGSILAEMPGTALQEEPRTHSLAVTSLILGAASFLSLVVAAPLGLLCAVAAIIFGLISLRKIKNDPEHFKGKGLASIGLGLGLTYLVLLVLAFIVLLSAFDF